MTQSSFYADGDPSTLAAVATASPGSFYADPAAANNSAVQAAASASAAATSATNAANAVQAAAGVALPIIDGTAATGIGTKWSREDHVHPTDASRAPLASPALTGIPTAPTAAVNTNTTQLASTAFVLSQAAAAAPVMDGAAAVGLATKFAREDHVHPTDTTRAPLASPAFTGIPTGPTAAAGTSTLQLATTAFCTSAAFFTQIGTGATSRSFASKLGDFFNAKDFAGVDPTGVADSTSGIAAAIAATPSGGMLFFSAGTYLVSGTGAYTFNLTTPINIVGAGSSIYGGTGTTFQVASVGTRDVFYVTGTLNAITRGYSFSCFNILGGSGGRHAIHFDSTAGTSTNFADVIIDRLAIGAASSGYSIYFNNGTGANPGPFNITVRDCYVNAGINFQKLGDTLRVLNNLITGTGIGIVCDQVSGAGQLTVIGNNITTNAGCLTVYNGISPMIAFNQMEQINANTEANNSMIDLIGNVSNAKIIGNQIQALTGTAIPIRVANAASTLIDGNRLTTITAYAPIVITAAATGTIIGYGNFYGGGGPRVSDAGTGTIYPIVSVKKQTFTVSGTYTPSPGMVSCIIECVGGGGGGGGATGTVGQIYSGGGGGAGGYSRLLTTAAAIGASKPVTIGAGGAGGLAGASGSVGGDTSVSALCVAKGGAGGLFGSSAQVPLAGAGGVAGTGDLASAGAAGLPGFYNSVNLGIAFPSGGGGSSLFGGGAQGVNAGGGLTTVGNAGMNYGGGGSGGATNNTASAVAGGAGSAGLIFITEYCSL